jgi:hypothetical protein
MDEECSFRTGPTDAKNARTKSTSTTGKPTGRRLSEDPRSKAGEWKKREITIPERTGSGARNGSSGKPSGRRLSEDPRPKAGEWRKKRDSN